MFGKNKKNAKAGMKMGYETALNNSETDVKDEVSSNLNIEQVDVPTFTSADYDTFSSGSFVIKKNAKKNPTIVLQEVDVAQLIDRYPVIESVGGFKKLKSPLLIITEQAESDIKKHISWGKKTTDNVCEQGGILIGKPYHVANSILGVVEYAIPAELSRTSSAYLEMGTETWMKMLNIYDEKYKENELFVIGWFHTHPNSLSVFMSSTDMGTQHAFFNQEWHFSIVLNPHRRLIACFNSVRADKCDFYPANFVER